MKSDDVNEKGGVCGLGRPYKKHSSTLREDQERFLRASRGVGRDAPEGVRRGCKVEEPRSSKEPLLRLCPINTD